MKNKTLYISIVTVIAFGTILYFFKTSHTSNNYLSAHGCNENMSNNAYTECAENALKKIQEQKQNSYDRFQELIRSNPTNALASDEKLNNEFQNWYKSSNDYNLSRCIASMYWSGAGSAYNQNIAECQIFETQRDIQLLDSLYAKSEYFKNGK